jgi:proton glutamate symport protein
MTASTTEAPKKKSSGTMIILIAMIIGIILGTVMPAADYPGFTAFAKTVSTVFLRMIKVLIVPLLFSTLVIGIAGHGDDMKKVGRL